MTVVRHVFNKNVCLKCAKFYDSLGIPIDVDLNMKNAINTTYVKPSYKLYLFGLRTRRVFYN